MQAYDCSYSFCAQSFTNWTTVNGRIVDGNRTTSSLRLDNPDTAFTPDQFYRFSTDDLDFPGDQNFSISYGDHVFIDEIFSSLFQSSGGIVSQGDYGDFILTALYSDADPTTKMDSIASSM